MANFDNLSFDKTLQHSTDFLRNCFLKPFFKPYNMQGMKSITKLRKM